ncbi:MAG TPA: pilus assembly protein TadG-related protein [Tepidisphaeraceae bacterium]|jgi:Flp pilus assembly protein TadG
MIYTLVVMVALLGFCSLAVDYGHVQLVKTELLRAADAASRAGAAALQGGISNSQQAAVQTAAANSADGTPVSINAAQDIEIGYWNGSSFVANSSSASNAVRVTVRRTAASGSGVKLALAGMLELRSCDVTARSLSTYRVAPMTGYTGLLGMVVKNNAFIASYNSHRDTDPTHESSSDRALVASNGTISAGMNGDVYGNVVLGPSASLSGFVVHGATTRRTAALDVPATPAWNPQPNPQGIPQNYTVNSSTTLPGGTYYFTALTLNEDLSFSGPATLYVNGDITIEHSLTAWREIPSNLTIYQLGSNRTFGDIMSNDLDIVAVVVAPGSDFLGKNNVMFRGSAIFNSMLCKNNADFYYDESSGPASGGKVIITVR